MLLRFIYIHKLKYKFPVKFYKFLSANQQRPYRFTSFCFAHSDCLKSTCNAKVNDKELLQKLWVESARQVGLGHWDPFTAEDTGELPPVQTQPGQH
jgi:hypothetical protein